MLKSTPSSFSQPWLKSEPSLKKKTNGAAAPATVALGLDRMVDIAATHCGQAEGTRFAGMGIAGLCALGRFGQPASLGDGKAIGNCGFRYSASVNCPAPPNPLITFVI